MTPRQRSLSGLFLALILVPVLAGLLACLPVPIGDPERSRIDTSLNGLWLWGDGVMLFEPYDKRTWLLSAYKIRDAKCTTKLGADPVDVGYENFIAKLRADETGCIEGELDGLYKAWLTDIGRGEFMTWEPRGGFDGEYGFEPDVWYGWRLQREGRDLFRLILVAPDFDGLDQPELGAKFETLEDQRPNDPKLLKSARRDLERLIRRNLDNADLYDEDYVFLRVRTEDYDLFVEQIVPESEH